MLDARHVYEKHTNWYARFQRVLHAFQLGLIPPAQQQAYQLFLLEHGQFNANFVLEELIKLKYPRSPFAIMHRHTYLRAVDHWALEILRLKYQEAHGDRLFPVFMHSELIWKELDRYFKLIKLDAVSTGEIDPTFEQAVANGGVPTHPIWVEIEFPAASDSDISSLELKKQAERLLRAKFLATIVRCHGVGESLIPVFQDIDKNQKITSDPSEIDALVPELARLFPRVLDLAREKHEQDTAWIQSLISAAGAITKRQIGKLFGITKKRGVLPQGLESPEQLEAFLARKQNNVNFLEYVKNSRYFQPPEPKNYVPAIKEWLKNHTKTELKELSKQIVYVYKDTSFCDLEAVVFCDCTTIPEHVNSVLGNLGYRLDPVISQRVVLKKFFPQAFFDREDTENLWTCLLKTPQIAELKDSERANIQALGLTVAENLAPPVIARDGYVIRNVDFNDELTRLRARTYPNSFILFARYISRYLDNFLIAQSENTALCHVVNPEIKRTLGVFLEAVERNNLPLAIRCTQTLAEIMLLDLSLFPLEKQLPQRIREGLLSAFPVQGVIMTPYAMRAFVRVFQLLDTYYEDRPRHIVVTNQSYFEWLQNIDRLDAGCYKISTVRYLSDIDHSADIIFMEIHPNNVVETTQFAHDIKGFLQSMLDDQAHWLTHARTLVIDATLNALNDEDIQNTLKKAQRLIKSGWLNIIIIQSLTKFSQLGLDKRSAGVLTVINNNAEHWHTVNASVRAFKDIEVVDDTTSNFFSYFLGLQQDLIKEYIRLVNTNVRTVYDRTLSMLDSLEVLSRDRFQITTSSDPKACYVALNIRGILADADPGLKCRDKDLEKFLAHILEYLLHPLCEFYGLPLTERMSIGFPMTSANCVFDSIRLTIGLENGSQLWGYAEILAFTAFVLNRQRDVALFFSQDDAGAFPLRIAYFQEKANQFKAMTPGSGVAHRFTFEYERTGSENTLFPAAPGGRRRQLKNLVVLENGVVHLFREIPDRHAPGHAIGVPHSPRTLIAPLRNIGDIPLSDPRFNQVQRKMIVACLTTCFREGQEKTQNVTLSCYLGDLTRGFPSTITFASFEIIGLWNMAFTYGPFNVVGKGFHAYFHLHHKRITLVTNESSYATPRVRVQQFDESRMLIRNGNVDLPLTDLPLTEREFLFRIIASEGMQRPHPLRDRRVHLPEGLAEPQMEYLPSRHESAILSIKHIGQKDMLVIEAFRLFYNQDGVRLSKRALGEKRTCVAVDIWGEKNPIVARFLRLMTAIYAKETGDKVSFIARNHHFRYFLFNVAFEAVDALLTPAAKKVIAQKTDLATKLNSHKNKSPLLRYSFLCEDYRVERPRWLTTYPSVQNVESTEDSELIGSTMKLLSP